MARMIRKGAMVLAVPAMLGTLAGTAVAEEAGPAAWADCRAGNACFWTGPNGTGQLCQWSGADTQHADDCGWAGDTNVRSVYNRGTNTAFAGLCAYRYPDYDPTAPVVFVPRGQTWSHSGAGWKMLSHRWVRPGVAC